MYEKFKELAEQESYDYVFKIIEGMPGGFFIYRAYGDEEIIYINKAALKIFGCDNYEEFHQLTGNTFKGMVHPDDIDEVERSIADQIAGSPRNMDYVEYRIRQKDGSVRRIADYGHFIGNSSAGDVFTVFIADDTERIRERAEILEKINKELVRSYARERKYRSAIIYDAMFFFEASITHNKLITDVTPGSGAYLFDMFSSPAAAESSDYYELIKISADMIAEGQRADYLEFFDPKRLTDCIERGDPEQTAEYTATDSLGIQHVIRCIVLLGKDKEQEISALIVVKDITDQTENRRLLNYSLQQARAANIAKNTFLANISHDIRTPLNAIIGFADLIRLGAENGEKTGEYLNNIKRSGTQLLAIVDEMLAVTRTEAEKTVLTEEPFDLNTLIDDVRSLISPEMKAKEMDFTVTLSDVTHFNISADVHKVKEILCRLLDNSAKYTDKGGTVSLSIKESTISNEYSKYIFAVEDNGIGISEEFRKIMYEPFSREHSTTESKVSGSGLGLTMVKNLVELMDGDIRLESICGKGSCFTVSVVLKLAETDGDGEIGEPALPVSLRGKRVLIADDNEINREIARCLLTETGILAETAEDGKIAVDMLLKAPRGYYDLVLMDIQMPNMNGYEAAKAIRSFEDEQLKNIPIIALSANAYAEDRKRSLESGMNAHAAKPIDVTKLIAIISDVLQKKG